MSSSRPRKRRVGADEPTVSRRVTPPGPDPWGDAPTSRRRHDTLVRVVVWVVVIAFVLPLLVGAVLALMT